jgi:hypothetical protein
MSTKLPDKIQDGLVQILALSKRHCPFGVVGWAIRGVRLGRKNSKKNNKDNFIRKTLRFVKAQQDTHRAPVNQRSVALAASSRNTNLSHAMVVCVAPNRARVVFLLNGVGGDAHARAVSSTAQKLE